MRKRHVNSKKPTTQQRQPRFSRFAGARFTFAVFVMLAFPFSMVFGETASTGDSMDALERQLELKRHEGLVAKKSAPDSALSDFTTDGCSGGLSAGWDYLAQSIPAFKERHGERPPWETCCMAHDRLYHVGGQHAATAEESFEARKEADEAFKACVLETGEVRSAELVAEYDLTAEQISAIYETIAALMYRAVRVGGIPCSGLPWRWGYGWPECD